MNDSDPTPSVSPQQTELLDIGRTLRAAVSRVPALAWSADGREFEFEVPLVHPVDVGHHVELTVDDGRRYVGYVVGKEIGERLAPSMHVELGQELDLGRARIGSAEVEVRLRVARGSGKLLWRIGADGARLDCGDGDRFLEAEIGPAEPSSTAASLAADGGAGKLDVGLRAGLPARLTLRASGFNRHTFVCGQSGSGKTFAFGVLLERLLADTDLRLVVLDPNGDYVRLATARAESDVVGPPVLPGHPTVAEMLARYAARSGDVTVLRPRSSVVPGGDDSVLPLVLELGDLEVDALAQVFTVDPIADGDLYAALVRLHRSGMADGVFRMDEARQLAAEDTSSDMAALVQRVSNFGIGRWGVWAEPGETSAIEVLRSDARVVVVDLSGFGHRREAATVAVAVLDHLWAERESRRPTLVAIDEAHNVCPAVPTEPLLAAASEQVDRIAAEGRKFGLHLLLSTQRPSKIPPNALSQCENLVLLRMNSASDIDHVAAAFSFVPRGLLDESRRFRQGEALLAGTFVSEPALARFDHRLSEEPGSDVPTTWSVAADLR